MQKREKILAVGLLTAVVGGLVIPSVFKRAQGPIASRKLQVKSLAKQLKEKEHEKSVAQARLTKMREWTERSLPPNPQKATLLYQQWLTDLAEVVAKFSQVRVTPEPMAPSRGNTYVAVRVKVTAQATVVQVRHFLYRFYQADLVHRVRRLSLEAEKNGDNPQLKVILTAEGLALRDASDRGTTLFARTQLAGLLNDDGTTMTVKRSDAFPKDGPFQVRIGGEYLTVTEVAGKTWTVRRDDEFTNPASHASDSVVELAPIHPRMKTRTPDDYKLIVEKNPFAKPREYEPRLEVFGSKTIVLGESLKLQAKVSNLPPTAGAPIYRLENAVAGMTIDRNSGQLVWSPSKEQKATELKVSVTATAAGYGKPLAETVGVTLKEPNHAPVLTSIEDQTAVTGQSLSVEVKATDPDPSNKLAFSLADGAPEGAAIDAASGVFKWTPAATVKSGEFEITVQVSDGGTPELTDSKTFKVSLSDDVAAFTFLTGVISIDERPQAWLYNRLNNKRLIVHEGDALKYAGVNGRVVQIGRDFLVLKMKDQTSRLELGKNLESIQKSTKTKAKKSK